MSGFIFGGDTGMTYEQVQQKRKLQQNIAESLMNTPSNLGEGLGQLGRALAYRNIDKKAGAAETEGRGTANELMQALMSQKRAPSDFSGIYQALGNPWMSDSQRAVVGAMMQNQQSELQDQRARARAAASAARAANNRKAEREWQLEVMRLEQEMKQNDPMYQAQLANLNRETELMGGPQKQPSSVQEYEFAKTQGYTGTFDQWKKSNAPQTNVNLYGDQIDPRPLVSDPETGIQRVWDEAGGTWRDSVIPGSGAAAEVQTAADKAEKRREGAATSTDTIATAAQRARDARGEQVVPDSMTGLASYAPFTASAEVNRQVGVLRSYAKVEALNAMREKSPTGGALGNVTEGETRMLEALAGALDPNSPTFLRDLDDYERTLLRTIHGKEAGDKLFEQSRQLSDEDLFKKYGG